jgi:hypothetical protein
VYDGRHLLVYVDAAAGDAVPLEGAQLGDPGGFTLGGAADWAVLNLQGEVAEAAVWAVVRSRQEIARDMLDTTWADAAVAPSLIARWTLHEGTGWAPLGHVSPHVCSDAREMDRWREGDPDGQDLTTHTHTHTKHTSALTLGQPCPGTFRGEHRGRERQRLGGAGGSNGRQIPHLEAIYGTLVACSPLIESEVVGRQLGWGDDPDRH